MPDAGYAPARGIWLSEPATATIHWYDPDGRPTRRFRLEVPLELVTSADRDFVEETTREGFQAPGNPAAQAMAQARIENADYHDPKAPRWLVSVDDRGYVWLLRHSKRGDTIHYEGREDSFWILSPQGESLRRTTPPGNPGASRGFLSVVDTDPDTGEYLPVVYRIESMVEGFEYEEYE